MVGGILFIETQTVGSLEVLERLYSRSEKLSVCTYQLFPLN